MAQHRFHRQHRNAALVLSPLTAGDGDRICARCYARHRRRSLYCSTRCAEADRRGTWADEGRPHPFGVLADPARMVGVPQDFDLTAPSGFRSMEFEGSLEWAFDGRRANGIFRRADHVR